MVSLLFLSFHSPSIRLHHNLEHTLFIYQTYYGALHRFIHLFLLSKTSEVRHQPDFRKQIKLIRKMGNSFLRKLLLHVRH